MKPWKFPGLGESVDCGEEHFMFFSIGDAGDENSGVLVLHFGVE